MGKFIDEIVEKIISKFGTEIHDHCFILPGRRASLFLQKSLSQALGKSSIKPFITDINGFLEEVSGTSISDQGTLLFELYITYKKVKKEKAESFHTFMNWGEIALADFREVDNYLIDSRNFFINLKNIKDIEEWSFGAEELSPHQKEYLHFWNDLGDLYHAFKSRMKEKGIHHSASLKREIAENISEFSFDQFAHIHVIGLNALSKSEERVFKYLKNEGLLDLYWDADSYLLDPDQEAGMFLRENQKTFGQLDFVHNSFLEIEKKIIFTELASEIGEVKETGALLQEMSKEELSETAVVLANESLLIPLLHSLPDNIENPNISLGFPLKNSPVSGLLEVLFKLHRRSSQGRERSRFYHVHLLHFLGHPYIKSLIQYDSASALADLKSALIKGHSLYPDISILRRHVGDELYEELSFLFRKHENASDWLETFTRLVDLLRIHFEEIANELALEFLFRFAGVLHTIRRYNEDFDFLGDTDTLHSLMRQLIHSERVPFFGQPLSGLQIIGMLETRAIDFKKVILIGANEDFLPKPKYDQSFIPFDLKAAFELPTYKQRDAIYAYYFYRLLSRSVESHVLYCSELQDFGGGERSRYIAQLEFHLNKENKSDYLEWRSVESSLPDYGNPEVRISKDKDTEKYLHAFIERGVSPSALHSYLSCPLDFFYTYLLGFRESQNMEEQMEASTFGTAIHDTLEYLYCPYIGKVLTANSFKEMNGRRMGELNRAFEKNYSLEEIRFGSNKLAFEVAREYIDKFLEFDMSRVVEHKSKGEEIKIMALEESISIDVDMSETGFSHTVKFKGKADRIEKTGSRINIIDYKTGAVKEASVKLKSLDDIPANNDASKAMQLMLYSWIYAKQTEIPPEEIHSGIISLRSLSQGPLWLSTENDEVLSLEKMEKFQEVLGGLLQDIFDSEKDFVHNPKSQYCSYCE